MHAFRFHDVILTKRMLSPSFCRLDLQFKKQRTCQLLILPTFNKINNKPYWLWYQYVSSFSQDSINIFIIMLELIFLRFMPSVMSMFAQNENHKFSFCANSELNIPNSVWTKINDENVLSKHHPNILDPAQFIWIFITNFKFTDYFGIALSDIKNSSKRLLESSEIKGTKSRIFEFGRVIALINFYQIFRADLKPLKFPNEIRMKEEFHES